MAEFKIVLVPVIARRYSSFRTVRAATGQLSSCGFVVLPRKSNPQNRNLKAAAELGVMFRDE